MMFKPEQMRNLPEPFTAEEKTKWENGLRLLWNQIEQNAPDSGPHLDAKRKLMEFSKSLANKLNAARQKQQGQSSQSGGGAQGQPPGPRPPSQGQPQQAQAGEGNTANANSGPANAMQQAQQQARAQPKVSQKLVEHVTGFPYVLPPSLVQGSQEAAKWIQDSKGKYLKALVNMESCSARVVSLDGLLQKRNDEGKPLNPDEEKDFKEKKEAAVKGHSEAKAFVEGFRAQQAQIRQAAQGNGQQQGTPQQGGGNNANNGGQGPPTRPQMNPQQVPNPTQTVNAAIEAARAQQMGGGRPSMPGSQGSNGQMPQGQMQNGPQMNQQMPNIKTEAGMPPQINTAVSQMQNNQGRPMQNNSPQSAVPRSAGVPQSATTQSQQQVPQALSHTEAIHQAARSYSQTGPSNVMGHSHPTAPHVPRETNVITNKMPIPKHLPERATLPPQPVQMQQSRPTYSGGPSNVGNGVISQPVIPKTPAYSMETEGDRVLSKKKLDELVRQVTGGGQGLEGGEGLTPDVEEVCAIISCHFSTLLPQIDT